jgi:hypothetical protein
MQLFINFYTYNLTFEMYISYLIHNYSSILEKRYELLKSIGYP